MTSDDHRDHHRNNTRTLAHSLPCCQAVPEPTWGWSCSRKLTGLELWPALTCHHPRWLYSLGPER